MWGIVQFSSRAVGQGADTASVGDETVVKWLLRLVYYRQQAHHARHGSYTDDLNDLGLARAPLAGRPWPPAMAVTPHGYEASLPAPPLSAPARPRRLLVTQDGAVR